MVRKAEMRDLPRILEIYDAARRYMVQSGNPTQWGDGYPKEELLQEDIAQGQLYVCCDGAGRAYGVFAFMLGEDPSYVEIDGAWPNDRPYGTIHRLASDGSVRGVFGECVDFCRGIITNLRGDTHPNNTTMQHLLEKHGFVRCGTILLPDQQEDRLRIAYQCEG